MNYELDSPYKFCEILCFWLYGQGSVPARDIITILLCYCCLCCPKLSLVSVLTKIILRIKLSIKVFHDQLILSAFNFYDFSFSFLGPQKNCLFLFSFSFKSFSHLNMFSLVCTYPTIYASAFIGSLERTNSHDSVASNMGKWYSEYIFHCTSTTISLELLVSAYFEFDKIIMIFPYSVSYVFCSSIKPLCTTQISSTG